MRSTSIFLKCFLILSLALSLGVLAHADDISVVADPYLPYTGDPNSDRPGFMIEILKVIFEKAGHTVSYRQVPWDEAMGLAKNGDVAALVGANREDALGFIFPEAEQALAQGVFYTSSTSPWKYKDAASLKKICLGVINKYNYSEIQSYIKENRSNAKLVRQFSDANALEKMAEALAEERIQAFAEDQNVMKEFLKTYPKAERIVEAGKMGSGTKLYAAFSPKNSNAEEYAKILSEGMKTIRADGTLATILKKYDLKVW